VSIKAKDAAVINAKTFENAIAIEKTVIVNRDFGFTGWNQRAIEINLNFGIHRRKV
jgi:hypothetical protein